MCLFLGEDDESRDSEKLEILNMTWTSHGDHVGFVRIFSRLDLGDLQVCA